MRRSSSCSIILHTNDPLTELSVFELPTPLDATSLARAITPTIASKQYGSEEKLASLVSEAALSVMPSNPKTFNVDNVRVVKIMGGGLYKSKVVQGMVFGREPEGDVKKVEKAKVAVFTNPIDVAQTETKGTVLIKNADEMLNFSRGEEKHMEKVKSITFSCRPTKVLSLIYTSLLQIFAELVDSGVKVVIGGTSIGELALHYLNRSGILVLKVLSKFELRRLCRVVGATPLARLGAPTPEEAGYVDVAETIEIGGDRVTVLRQESSGKTRTATVVLRGATQNHLDDLERAVDDGVSALKALIKDGRLVPGAGATELALARKVDVYGAGLRGLAQHAVKKFASALEVVPRTLAENALGGSEGNEVVARLLAKHEQEGEGKVWGVDVEANTDGTLNTEEASILDSLAAKSWAIKLAAEAAVSVLAVDSIIMSRPAGGPKVPKQAGNWDADD